MLFLRLEDSSKNTIIKTGNAIPAKIPAFRPACSADNPCAAPQLIRAVDFCDQSEIIPESHGPREQPASPNIARTANIAVPPVGMRAEVKERTPGQNKLTEKPVNAQANSATTALGEKTTVA